MSGGALYVRVGNTDAELIHRLADALGRGTIYGPYQRDEHDGWRRKPVWVWIARKEDGLDCLALMWPWLSRRRRLRANELTGIPFHVFSRIARELVDPTDCRPSPPATAA